jgi:hypothetical protein
MDERMSQSSAISTTPAGVATDAPARAPYTSPRLERLGSWRALTLQQSVPIFP